MCIGNTNDNQKTAAILTDDGSSTLKINTMKKLLLLKKSVLMKTS